MFAPNSDRADFIRKQLSARQKHVWGTRLIAPVVRVQDRSHLRQQTIARVWLRNEATQALRQHGADLTLLGKPTAQDDIYTRVDGAQFFENRIAIQDRQKEI